MKKDLYSLKYKPKNDAYFFSVYPFFFHSPYPCLTLFPSLCLRAFLKEFFRVVFVMGGGLIKMVSGGVASSSGNTYKSFVYRGLPKLYGHLPRLS